MTHSRQHTSGHKRPTAAGRASGHHPHTVPLASAIAAILAGAPAFAQQQQSVGALEEVVVTAQKKSENLQDVPVAILALGTEKLEELHVQNLDDYVKFLPSVSYSRGQGQGGNGQPGSSHVYMRGVVSGANENHTGSQPSVGTYLDEQPVTTIDGTVDVHVYDIERVEVLEGPQGTLYGASSQAGTIRIITNKPDPKKFAAGYDFSLNQINKGGAGYTAEGFVNLPLTPVAAIRLVGWVEHDGGFINNVAGTNRSAGIINGVRTFNTWAGQRIAADGSGSGAPPFVLPTPTTIGAGSISNAAYVKDNYNTADTKGGRAALKLLLGDNWTVTPTFMGQSVNSEGFFGYDPVVGDLQLAHFGPENSQDNWIQTALTVEGKIANLDVVYAGAWMKRDTHSIADYSDYSFFYDNLHGYGSSWVGNGNGNTQVIEPQQVVVSKGYFQKFSHELRFSTPQQYPVKATFGAFVERQLHDIYEDYVLPGFGFITPYGSPKNPAGFSDFYSIPSTPGNTIWLTDEQRVDRDRAVFAQLTWDISSQFSANVGWREFKSDNTVVGFFGYSKNFSGSGSGMSKCGPQPYVIRVRGTPCTNLDKRVAESGHVPRYNLTYKITPDAMIYATYSKGFRPGGINRTAQVGVGPYVADFLTNKELGWKTSWFNNHLRWNGSVFVEDWNNFQFSFLGVNSVTIIKNGGNAKIKGIDTNVEWAVGGGLTLSAAMELLQSRLQQNYCGFTDPSGQTVTSADCTYPGEDFTNPNNAPFTPLAPAGADMPIAPKFKANTVARYGFELDGWDAHLQAAIVYQTQTAPALKTQDQQLIGKQPAYALIDLSAGIEKNGMSVRLLVNNAADRRAQLSRFEQCTVNVCLQPYVIPAQPRTVAIAFGQKF